MKGQPQIPIGFSKDYQSGFEAGQKESLQTIAEKETELSEVNKWVEVQREVVKAKDEEIKRLRTVLANSVNIIEQWHGKVAFDIYYNNAPEMKEIREALNNK